MQTFSKLAIAVFSAALWSVPLLAAEGAKRTWTFDDETAGQIARGFTNTAVLEKGVMTPAGKIQLARRMA